MSTGALTSALSGLRVAQQALDLTANNISNAGTEGYTRKTLPQEAIVLGDNVAGVQANAVQRYVDQYVMRDFRTQTSLQGYLDTKKSYLNRLVSLHGRPEQETNIAAKIGTLKNIFTDLSSVPESKVLQTQVVDVATNLAESMNKMASTLMQQRTQSQNELSDAVKTINTKLEEIASLNKRIQSAMNAGKSTATLEDARDQAVKKVSEQLDITYFINGEGSLVVQTKAGQVLADSEARTIEFNPTPLGYASSYPVNAAGITLVDTQHTYDLTEAGIGGKMGALLELRDEIIPTYQAQLDELAHKMALRFEAQNVRLFTNKAGVIPPDDPSQYIGFSGEIQVNPIVANNPSLVQTGTSGATPNAGDNSIIMNIINYTFGNYQDSIGTQHPDFRVSNIGPNNSVSINVIFRNTTLEDFAQSMIGRMAADSNDVNSRSESEEIYTTDIEKMLLDGSAVDSDEEMAELIKLQQSYTAAAKMITTLDNLFKELLNVI